MTDDAIENGILFFMFSCRKANHTQYIGGNSKQRSNDHVTATYRPQINCLNHITVVIPRINYAFREVIKNEALGNSPFFRFFVCR